MYFKSALARLATDVLEKNGFEVHSSKNIKASKHDLTIFFSLQS